MIENVDRNRFGQPVFPSWGLFGLENVISAITRLCLKSRKPFTIYKKTRTAHPAWAQRKCAPESAPGTVEAGENNEELADREVGLIARRHETN